LGLKSVLQKGDDVEDFAKKIDKNTKAICLETIRNPRLNIPDFQKFGELAKEYGCPGGGQYLWAAGYLFNLSSGSKYRCGICNQMVRTWYCHRRRHCRCRKLQLGQWKISQFTEPSEGYHGLKFWDVFGAGNPLAFLT
jgi:O-acetylhomoserine (thiol)-lyase